MSTTEERSAGSSVATAAPIASPALPRAIASALARRPSLESTEVRGAGISWLSWGDPDKRPLIFVHGGAANAWWWSFTAPLLADRFHVVAMDLSGHGDSDHRDRYSFNVWAEEACAIAEQWPDSKAPIVIGHSMGGIVATMATRVLRPELFAGLITVDSPLVEPDQDTLGRSDGVFSRGRTYARRGDAVGRFRPLPPQPQALPALVRHIADYSVRQDADGSWGWKFDPRVFAVPADARPEDVGLLVAQHGVPTGLIIGGESPIVPEHDRARIRQWASEPGRRTQLRIIEGGEHHLMFDRPMELIDSITELIDAWLAEHAG